MSDNLPEINIKRNKEKRGGFLGWLRGLGSGGARGGSIAGSASTGSAGFGGALGAGGGFGGSSAGIGALLAGKMGTILTIAAVAVAGGTYLVHNSPDTAVPNGALSSNKAASAEYVPAIVRSQAANQGSSLAMFTNTNKGSGLSLQEAVPGSKKAAKNAEAAADATAASAAKDGAAADQAQGVAEQAAGGLQGGMGASSLTTSIGGGGSGKFTSLGKFGQGAIGPKVGLSGSPGTGFQAMPKFQERKGKLLAMKGGARPVFSSGKGGKPAKFSDGTKSWNQARAMNAKQRSYTGSKADQAAATQNEAWTGTTATGDAGAGLAEGDGGAGIVTSPSLDNASGGTGTGDTGTTGPATFNDPCPSGDYAACAEDISPWKATATKCNMLILAATALALIGGMLVKIGDKMMLVNYTLVPGQIIRGIGIALCIAAIAAAAAALALAVILGTKFHQAWMATIYGIGAILAGVAGAMGLSGDISKAVGVSTTWVAMAASICSMIAGMLG
ncbi:MAG: hypothetical protein NTY45_11090 [Elusimicrobia bacterium]|nr:hypothetical protein [Elusimicrobiota bacterium]